ncbi:DNA adenine methylase Dam [Rivularia sp. PCC 7116]|uniref:DNA adenine methylase n=1 Tax=Rivularia sp. PCC 7116 TaxID=373994 RepID=UPI00029F37AF|nr:DNA adenine methylase [Rivularia sp. PCC 7116]AFY57091.1 DNA adenine methylase Dam [Rivularia sp. PCC 7116]
MVSQISKQAFPRPFLKWAGGKSKLIPQIRIYLPEAQTYKNYYEPFLGGGAVFFHLQPYAAMLTDVNSELIDTYNCVKNNLEELISLLKIHENNHSKEYYYSLRQTLVKTDLEKAARLIYLNKTCFNGLYRVNSKGQFNVPLGRYKNPKICPIELLYSACETLQLAQIRQADFSEVLDYATSSDDFVFFDPPYHPISSTSYFTAYSRNSFTKDDQIRLRDTCAELASRGVKIMVCNSDCQFIKELYTEINFKIFPIKAPRVINSNIKNRGTIHELLITSY